MSKPSCVVFVGNIPFDTTEEAIRDFLADVGPIVNFKLIFDQESGKPKGYGFCEYNDIETASSAIRNLQGIDLNGRKIRLDYADPMSLRKGNQDHQHTQTAQNFSKPVDPNIPTTQAIAQIISSLTLEDKRKLLSQIKASALKDYPQTRNILLQSPQLAYALFHTIVELNLINPPLIQKILAPTLQQNQPQAPPVHSSPNPQNFGVDQNTQLVSQVMSLTQEQIQLLPADQQRQILELRAQFGGSFKNSF
ncbi:hypothetical protein BB559_001200 [Furculomyces boomerangus]|uniref:RRM domain-containing protein n=2 Tax=Harpellales TaxID=61421 RepID=A0A2T9Z2S8_9FUNG|nr:hypothetical protein BB559_001200 [Furculomyces boomerangus]PVZ99347.1 hypothetical protein BB558_004637 [Smittium angustum]